MQFQTVRMKLFDPTNPGRRRDIVESRLNLSRPSSSRASVPTSKGPFLPTAHRGPVWAPASDGRLLPSGEVPVSESLLTGVLFQDATPCLAKPRQPPTPEPRHTATLKCRISRDSQLESVSCVRARRLWMTLCSGMCLCEYLSCSRLGDSATCWSFHLWTSGDSVSRETGLCRLGEGGGGSCDLHSTQ